MSEISLWLDSYDDIYSDFDSRNFLKRRISEDFLHELRLSKKYKRERVTDLLLFMPGEKRKESSETVIINSLKNFFGDQLQMSGDKYRIKRNKWHCRVERWFHHYGDELIYELLRPALFTLLCYKNFVGTLRMVFTLAGV